MKRVLIVDDSPVIQSMLKKLLEKNGYEICGEAKNGKEGLELYDILTPDFVFMDVTISFDEDLQAAAKLKSKHPDAKIILLASMEDKEIIAEAKTSGVGVLLDKPFDEGKLIKAIEQLG